MVGMNAIAFSDLLQPVCLFAVVVLLTGLFCWLFQSVFRFEDIGWWYVELFYIALTVFAIVGYGQKAIEIIGSQKRLIQVLGANDLLSNEAMSETMRVCLIRSDSKSVSEEILQDRTEKCERARNIWRQIGMLQKDPNKFFEPINIESEVPNGLAKTIVSYNNYVGNLKPAKNRHEPTEFLMALVAPLIGSVALALKLARTFCYKNPVFKEKSDEDAGKLKLQECLMLCTQCVDSIGLLRRKQNRRRNKRRMRPGL